MTFVVKKSFLRANPSFEIAVAAHAKELSDWLEREKRVAKDAENPNIPDIERWVSCPRPEAPNPVVASAVNELGLADYSVEDDDPTPEELLTVKKAKLFKDLQDRETKARNDVLAVTKRPLREIRSADIASADQDRRAKVLGKVETEFSEANKAYVEKVAEIQSSPPGVMKRIAIQIGVSEDPRSAAIAALDVPKLPEIDVEAEVAKMRPADDNEFLEQNGRMAVIDDLISRNTAQALHDIEDLTVDTVDSYIIPDLTKQA